MIDWVDLPVGLAQLDVAWLATDRLGQVGLFVTAGNGPIPVVAIASVDTVEDEVLSLPERGPATSLLATTLADAFTRFASRGVFVYDWSDAHRSDAESLHAYELVAAPSRPIRIDALPPQARALATACSLDVTFGTTTIAPGARLKT